MSATSDIATGTRDEFSDVEDLHVRHVTSDRATGTRNELSHVEDLHNLHVRQYHRHSK